MKYLHFFLRKPNDTLYPKRETPLAPKSTLLYLEFLNCQKFEIFFCITPFCPISFGYWGLRLSNVFQLKF